MEQPELTSNMERRRFLKILGAGATLMIPVGWKCAEGSDLVLPDDDLPLTPSQAVGPFYPIPSIEQQMFNDTDLTRKLSSDDLANGQLVTLGGVVTDRKGRPLNQSVVEIWQASSDGLYNHPDDHAADPELDHDFQYWGRFITGEHGEYLFSTILPGEYTGRTARHIHFRIDAPGYRRLTTQSYFSNYGERNMRDGLYRSLNRMERNLVTVEFDTSPDQSWKGDFNIVLAEG